MINSCKLVNSGSNLLIDLFDEAMGCHARTAIVVNMTPKGIACEIEVLVELKE
ncbi:MAG: hypothetical protein WCS30_07535 [Selenomonadaceae bacterium]